MQSQQSGWAPGKEVMMIFISCLLKYRYLIVIPLYNFFFQIKSLRDTVLKQVRLLLNKTTKPVLQQHETIKV